MTYTIRTATSADADSCGSSIYEAFRGIEERYGYPHFYASPIYAIQIANLLIKNPAVLGLVAEVEGRVAGCCFLHNYGSAAGIGPVAVDPQHQDCGIGRALVSSALERSNCSRGIRLKQDAANVASLALYASLGFEVREPLVLAHGLISSSEAPKHIETREIGPKDVDEAASLCERVYGFAERETLDSGFVALRDGRVTGYSPGVSIHGYGVADSEEDIQALLTGTGRASRRPVSFLLPLRLGGLVRWCLGEGLQLVRPMMLMTTGSYHEPEGCFFPSLIR